MLTRAKVLITGGAGYIGCHLVKILQDTTDLPLLVLDNLETGFSEAVLPPARLIKGDIRDSALLDNLLGEESIEAVIHLAASTLIPESIQNPGKYYDNNTLGTLKLLQACAKHRIKYFIFSSTAAVYGPSPHQKLKEESPLLPQNPYGHSKLMAEQMIRDFGKAYGIHYVILRYFNVAGACPSGLLGQRNIKANHLIKTAVQTACGQLPSMPLFGNDYETKDGSCIRDFIHVSDLAEVHIQALHYLKDHENSVTLNCGYGQGYSVKEVIATIEKISGHPLPLSIEKKRAGDLPIVIADVSKLQQLFNWKPQYASLNQIIETALNWEKSIQAFM